MIAIEGAESMRERMAGRRNAGPAQGRSIDGRAALDESRSAVHSSMQYAKTLELKIASSISKRIDHEKSV